MGGYWRLRAGSDPNVKSGPLRKPGLDQPDEVPEEAGCLAGAAREGPDKLLALEAGESSRLIARAGEEDAGRLDERADPAGRWAG